MNEQTAVRLWKIDLNDVLRVWGLTVGHYLNQNEEVINDLKLNLIFR